MGQRSPVTRPPPDTLNRGKEEEIAILIYIDMKFLSVVSGRGLFGRGVEDEYGAAHLDLVAVA